MATYNDILDNIKVTTDKIVTISGSVETMITEISTLKTDFEQAITDAISTNFDATLQESLKNSFGLNLNPLSEDPAGFYQRDVKGDLVLDGNGDPIPVQPINLYPPIETEDSSEQSGASHYPYTKPEGSISYSQTRDSQSDVPLAILEGTNTLPIDLSFVKETANSAKEKAEEGINRANSAQSTANSALAKALSAMSVAQQARSIARSANASAVADSDAETPPYVSNGGGPQ